MKQEICWLACWNFFFLLLYDFVKEQADMSSGNFLFSVFAPRFSSWLVSWFSASSFRSKQIFSPGLHQKVVAIWEYAIFSGANQSNLVEWVSRLKKKDNGNYKSELFDSSQQVMELKMPQGISNIFLIVHRKRLASGPSHYTSNKMLTSWVGQGAITRPTSYQCPFCSKDPIEKSMFMSTFDSTSHTFMPQAFSNCPWKVNALFWFQGRI